MRKRRNIDSRLHGSDAARQWKEEKKHLKEGQAWLRVKAVSLNEFHLIRELGRGFYGPLKLVKHKATANLYVVKAYHHTGEVEDEQVIQQLSNERTLLMEVNSVWVECMHHCVQDSHVHFILLEYIPGGSLAQLMQQEGSFQEPQARFYGAEMLMAINVLHRYGFMHRNIQPSNFLIDQSGHLKVVDFGTSVRFLPAETCTRMAAEDSIRDGKPYLSEERRDRVKIYQRKSSDKKAGSEGFMPPEVVRKRPKGFLSSIRAADSTTSYSFAVDFWSFGVCMYYFLFGQMPFEGKTTRELSCQIVDWRKNLSFPIVLPISAEAKDLIKRLLCDEPYRLGVNGCEEVMSHVFFDSVDWEHLRDWPVPVPYRPEHEGSSDTSLQPPACIADLFQQAPNRASNNDKVSGSLQPHHRQDHLHSAVGNPAGPDAALPHSAMQEAPPPPLPQPAPEATTTVRATTTIPPQPTVSFPAPAVEGSGNQVCFLPSVSGESDAVDELDSSLRQWQAKRASSKGLYPSRSSISRASAISSSQFLSQACTSLTSMAMSCSDGDEDRFSPEHVREWLQSSNFNVRPSTDDLDTLGDEWGSRSLSVRELHSLRKKKAKAEPEGDDNQSKNKSECAVM